MVQVCHQNPQINPKNNYESNNGVVDVSKDKKQAKQTIIAKSGYQPIKKGYQPIQGALDSSNPPQGGSGVPSKSPNKSKKSEQ